MPLVLPLRLSDKFKWFETCNWLSATYGVPVKPLPVALLGIIRPTECATSSNFAQVLFYLRTSPEAANPRTLSEISVWVSSQVEGSELQYIRRVIASLCGEALQAYLSIDHGIVDRPYRCIPIHALLSRLTRNSKVEPPSVSSTPLTHVIPAYPALCFPYLHSVAAQEGYRDFVFPPPRGFFEGVYQMSVEVDRMRKGKLTWRVPNAQRVPIHYDVTVPMTNRVAAGDILQRLERPRSRQGLEAFKRCLVDASDSCLEDAALSLAWRVVQQNSSARYLSSLPKEELVAVKALLESGDAGLLSLADRLVMRRVRIFAQRPRPERPEQKPVVEAQAPEPTLPVFCASLPTSLRRCVLIEMRRSALASPPRRCR